MSGEFDVFIEIAQGSPLVKYEHKDGLLRVTRIVDTNKTYPVNYGYIPKTLAEDDDAVDAMVLTPFPLHPGSTIQCQALGVLKTEDQNGPDPKILAIPASDIMVFDHSGSPYKNIKSYKDLSKFGLSQIVQFFKEYKELIPDHWTKVEGWGSPVDAYKEISDGQNRWFNSV